MAQSWICDSCGTAITGAQDGWVEWLVENESRSFRKGSLRLVHAAASAFKGACQYNDGEVWASGNLRIQDQALDRFIGGAGLAEALHHVSQGTWPADEGGQMIARIHGS